MWHLSTGWTQLSAVNPEYILALDFNGDYKHEIVADFGSLGLWMWSGGTWSQVSANNPD